MFCFIGTVTTEAKSVGVTCHPTIPKGWKAAKVPDRLKLVLVLFIFPVFHRHYMKLVVSICCLSPLSEGLGWLRSPRNDGNCACIGGIPSVFHLRRHYTKPGVSTFCLLPVYNSFWKAARPPELPRLVLLLFIKV